MFVLLWNYLFRGKKHTIFDFLIIAVLAFSTPVKKNVLRYMCGEKPNIIQAYVEGQCIVSLVSQKRR